MMQEPKNARRPDRHDWEAEARGLAGMLLTIAARYRQAKALGGDSELLRSSVVSSERYVREVLDPLFWSGDATL